MQLPKYYRIQQDQRNAGPTINQHTAFFSIIESTQKGKDHLHHKQYVISFIALLLILIQ